MMRQSQSASVIPARGGSIKINASSAIMTPNCRLCGNDSIIFLPANAFSCHLEQPVVRSLPYETSSERFLWLKDSFFKLGMTVNLSLISGSRAEIDFARREKVQTKKTDISFHLYLFPLFSYYRTMSLYSEKIRVAVKKFPETPGVYLMRDAAGEIIYIGKATSLKARVGSYFQKALNAKTAKLVEEIARIDFRLTDSVVEALILEANLVSQHQPKYNIRLKDDKYFANILITAEAFPRVLVIRNKQAAVSKIKARRVFGPYISKRDAQMVVDLLVRIFLRGRSKSTDNLYLRYYLKGYKSGRVGDINQRDYLKIITRIESFLSGKKSGIVRSLEKEMQAAARAQDFETAAALRDQLFALQNIRDTAFMTNEDALLENARNRLLRVEGYDISNTSGLQAVGSMVVFRKGKPDKDEYRKFKIKSVHGPDDPAMMREVLRRRFAHPEWAFPDLIVMDGGLGQVNACKLVLSELGIRVPIVGIAKGPDRKGEKLFFSGPKNFIFPDLSLIKKVRDESHRFAISYHRALRQEAFF